MIRILLAISLLVSAAANAQDGGMREVPPGLVTKASPYSVVETTNRIEAAARAIGANIFNRIDYQELSRKAANIEVKPNQLLIFGRGKGGPYLIREAPLSAIDLPFKALAWEDANGKVWVTYTTGTFIGRRYTVEGAAEFVKNIDDTIEKLVADALR